MFIRHAEKPGDGENGVTADNSLDKESLTVRGWQRAGALIAFFAQPKMKPTAIFASGIGHGSNSKRPMETVTPLVNRLNEIQPVTFNTNHLKDEIQPLISKVLSLEGTVLVCWEHKRIPDLAALLPAAPPVPQLWPDNRFDVVWIFDRAGAGWTFSQMLQRLLPQDGDKPIIRPSGQETP
jgi:broad specificity phosphatase PhoE